MSPKIERNLRDKRRHEILCGNTSENLHTLGFSKNITQICNCTEITELTT